MPGGRPTAYTPELLEKAHGYLSVYKDEGDVIPSHVGLALYLDISTVCMYDWAKQEEKKEFSNILAKIKAAQHQSLINNGLDGKFNSNITKLVLGKHGYHEKQEVDQTSRVSITIESKDAQA
jgi:hypothetical protein